MNYASVSEFTSVLYPEVSVTLRKMSVERRREFHLAVAKPLEDLRKIQDEREPLRVEWQQILDTAKLGPCTCTHPDEEHDKDTRMCKAKDCSCRTPKIPDELYAKLGALDERERRLDEDVMQPAVLKWGVKAITGLTIDDKPATVETLITDGPTELSEELAREVTKRMRRTGEEQKNLQPPTTTSEQVEATTPTTAASAKTGDTTQKEIAASSSPTT